MQLVQYAVISDAQADLVAYIIRWFPIWSHNIVMEAGC